MKLLVLIGSIEWLPANVWKMFLKSPYAIIDYVCNWLFQYFIIAIFRSRKGCQEALIPSVSYQCECSPPPPPPPPPPFIYYIKVNLSVIKTGILQTLLLMHWRFASWRHHPLRFLICEMALSHQSWCFRDEEENQNVAVFFVTKKQCIWCSVNVRIFIFPYVDWLRTHLTCGTDLNGLRVLIPHSSVLLKHKFMIECLQIVLSHFRLIRRKLLKKIFEITAKCHQNFDTISIEKDTFCISSG